MQTMGSKCSQSHRRQPGTGASFAGRSLLLLVGALFDRTRGSQRLGREIVVGSLAGLFAAFAYDIFRLPFVFAPDLSIDRILPPLQIFSWRWTCRGCCPLRLIDEQSEIHRLIAPPRSLT